MSSEYRTSSARPIVAFAAILLFGGTIASDVMSGVPSRRTDSTRGSRSEGVTYVGAQDGSSANAGQPRTETWSSLSDYVLLMIPAVSLAVMFGAYAHARREVSYGNESPDQRVVVTQTVVVRERSGCGCCSSCLLLTIIIFVGVPVMAFVFKVAFFVAIVEAIRNAVEGR